VTERGYLRIKFALLDMPGQSIQFDDGGAAMLLVITPDIQPGQQILQDSTI
jgi:hypothetical protein